MTEKQNKMQDKPQHDGSLLQHKAPILIEHQSISSNQQLLALLLNTSKALAEAITEQLIGSVSICFQVYDKPTMKCVPGFADFISKRGHILRGEWLE